MHKFHFKVMHPFPASGQDEILNNQAIACSLSASEQSRLRDLQEELEFERSASALLKNDLAAAEARAAAVYEQLHVSKGPSCEAPPETLPRTLSPLTASTGE